MIFEEEEEMSGKEELEQHRASPLHILQVLAVFWDKKTIPSTFHFEMVPFVDAKQDAQNNQGVCFLH